MKKDEIIKRTKRRNFSPGPWKSSIHSGGLMVQEVILVQSQKNHIVCGIPTYPRQRAPHYNAELIQQAPEMYDLLEIIAAQIDPEHFGSSIFYRIMEVMETINF